MSHGTSFLSPTFVPKKLSHTSNHFLTTAGHTADSEKHRDSRDVRPREEDLMRKARKQEGAIKKSERSLGRSQDFQHLVFELLVFDC